MLLILWRILIFTKKVAIRNTNNQGVCESRGTEREFRKYGKYPRCSLCQKSNLTKILALDEKPSTSFGIWKNNGTEIGHKLYKNNFLKSQGGHMMAPEDLKQKFLKFCMSLFITTRSNWPLYSTLVRKSYKVGEGVFGAHFIYHQCNAGKTINTEFAQETK